MKPFDGGQWVGVTRIRDAAELHAVYDASGERLMHLQAAVEDFDVFARSLSIGAETMVMHFEPDRPLHDRYQIDHDFLSPELGDEVVTISKLVNAFFRWEFNSCETIVKDGVAYPIDYANASPDVALTSLHYYFPWAILALVRWSAFCTVTGRPMRINQGTRDYFAIGDRDDLSYEEKLARVPALADAYFQADEYEAFCAEQLPHLEEALTDYVAGPEFDRMLVDTVHDDVPGARARAVRRALPRHPRRLARRPAAGAGRLSAASGLRRGRGRRCLGGRRAGSCGASSGRTTPTCALLGAPLSQRHWRRVGTAVHLANGAAAGMLFDRLGLRGWKAGVVAAQVENALLWPGSAVIDRLHPDRHSAAWSPLVRNRRVFAQEVVAHALFGAVLGTLVRERAELRPPRVRAFASARQARS